MNIIYWFVQLLVFTAVFFVYDLYKERRVSNMEWLARLIAFAISIPLFELLKSII